MVLLTPWALFQGAPPEVIERAKEEGDDELLDEGGNALEMAIISSSKRFIRSPSCQKVIEGIWSGRIIYSALNAHALIADNYKKKPIQMYNPHKAPLLDHYRLKVPKYRSFLEYSNFLILFVLYVTAMEGIEGDRLNAKEMAFIIYALSFSLDKLAAVREHGLKVFSSSLVNGFDLVFMLIYAVYLGARTYGFHYGSADALALGADFLAIGAVLIFPRLAFVTLANNLMVLSIRSMLTEFFCGLNALITMQMLSAKRWIVLMGVGIFCFIGFAYALYTLGQGRFEFVQIGWWLLEVYFGLDASGFEAAHNFHPFLGPLLMITYALLSNTLLLTVLVAILGNTFATINADAVAESMFRKAVSTIEGVKADAVFSYQLPFNLVAVVFMWPMSYILNPRWFHKVNVFMIRASNLPVLLVIALYERQKYRETTLMEQFGDFAERYVGSLPRRLRSAAGFENFGSRRDIGAVFEIEREVGSFYRGWEDEGFDDSAIVLPGAFDEDSSDAEEGKVAPSEPQPNASSPRQPGRGATGAQEVLVHSEGETAPLTGGPLTASPQPSPIPDRTRRKSMPAAQQHQLQQQQQQPHSPHPPSPLHAVFPAGPMARPRRNSSIHEPSPLARLFVRSPDNPDMGGLRERRQSLAHSALNAAGMPMSQSHPTLSSVLAPMRPRRQSRASTAFSPSEAGRLHATSTKPSVPVIEESRPGTPRSGSGSESGPQNQDRHQSQSQSQSRDPGPPPRTGRSVRFPQISDDIGGADDMVSPRTTVVSGRGTAQKSSSDMSAGDNAAAKAEQGGTVVGRGEDGVMEGQVDDGVAKASELVQSEMDKPEEEMEMEVSVERRLEKLEQGQRRIEELLQGLVQAAQGR
ncbi:hypothetical protein JCM24511_05000 [Saitozyma sp. JCM 24511]|nr:hypothetical protein JCM24511_05000 [Saitozyma sp. JCM 24511]